MNAFDALFSQPKTTEKDLQAAYYRAAKRVHPDAGGSSAAFVELRHQYLRALANLAHGDSDPHTDSGVKAEPDRRASGQRVGADGSPLGRGAAHGSAARRSAPARATALGAGSWQENLEDFICRGFPVRNPDLRQSGRYLDQVNQISQKLARENPAAANAFLSFEAEFSRLARWEYNLNRQDWLIEQILKSWVDVRVMERLAQDPASGDSGPPARKAEPVRPPAYRQAVLRRFQSYLDEALVIGRKNPKWRPASLAFCQHLADSP